MTSLVAGAWVCESQHMWAFVYRAKKTEYPCAEGLWLGVTAGDGASEWLTGVGGRH